MIHLETIKNEITEIEICSVKNNIASVVWGGRACPILGEIDVVNTYYTPNNGSFSFEGLYISDPFEFD